MGCRVQFCIGGGCVPTDTTPQDWVEAFGYTYNENDPLASVYTNIIANYAGRAAVTIDETAWAALAEGCMRTRAILFCNSNPGDAGSTSSGAGTSALLGESLSVGSQAASTIEQFAQVASATAGAVTLGVTDVLAGILQIFQAHAAAEQRQATALSHLAPEMTEAIRKADYAVATGQATAEDAVGFLQQIFASAKQAVAPLEHSCNAFCWYDDIFDLIVEVSSQYYQLGLSSAALMQTDETNIIPLTSVNVTPNEGQSTTPITTLLLPSVGVSSNGLLFGLVAVVLALVVFGGGDK